ncbi:MAG: DUF177 domain-containing protein [Bacteroidales bacterium]|nr:DUF177 domain-containing protein [Bacteroidales bacterium]
MKIRNQYIIPFGGLKEGYHDFNFAATREFFEAHPELEASDGNLNIDIRMLKRSTFLTFEVSIQGNITLQCDRCLDAYIQDIRYNGNLYVKFSERNEHSEENEDIIFLNPAEHEIDLEHYIYESISLSIPLKRMHPDVDGLPACNRAMMEQLKNHTVKLKEQETNPAWDKLKDILGTNNN